MLNILTRTYVTHPNPTKGNGPIDDPAGGWSAMYLNECMNGFEYQVAGHMIWEGMVQEGLAITPRDRRPVSRHPAEPVERGGVRRPLCALDGELRRVPGGVRL